MDKIQFGYKENQNFSKHGVKEEYWKLPGQLEMITLEWMSMENK